MSLPNRHRYLYFVRHGQYVRTPAHRDGELTDLGVRQAERVADRLASLPLDAIWSSTMYRAEETAEVIADLHFPHLEVRRSTLLREKLFPCDRQLWRDAPARFRAPEDRLERIASRWLRRSNRERHELIVCHGNVIRAIVTHILGVDVDAWIRMGTANCGLTRIACRDDGRRMMLSYNETAYLPRDFVTH
jgi:broad specificity phosphatase PhoE